MASRVLIPVAEGSEELELIAGNEVTIASVSSTLSCKCARSTVIVADAFAADVKTHHFDAIIIPGGMPGASNIADCSDVISMLRVQKESGKWYGGICAAPAVVLSPHGLLEGVAHATCYPNEKFRLALGDKFTADSKVVVDHGTKCITSRGPATALEMGLELVRILNGEDKRKEIAIQMLVE